jgi:transcriptional regulator with XRE-family HTH domain
MTKATGKNRIRELRQKLGLTAKNLAERVDTTEATISRIESGKQSLSQAWLQKIAHTLGVHIADLLGDGPGITADYAPVIARVENGKWLEEPFYKGDQIYGIPVLAHDKSLELSAFEWTVSTEGYLIAAILSKLKAANYIGKPFVVGRVDESRRLELSFRILEHRQQGLYLVSKEDDISPQAVRLDDENVAMVWRVVMEYRTY